MATPRPFNDEQRERFATLSAGFIAILLWTPIIMSLTATAQAGGDFWDFWWAFILSGLFGIVFALFGWMACDIRMDYRHEMADQYERDRVCSQCHNASLDRTWRRQPKTGLLFKTKIKNR